jgi:hypothetical protein
VPLKQIQSALRRYLVDVVLSGSCADLPELTFVFTRADRPFVRLGPPTPAGLAVTLALVATLASVDGGGGVAANQHGAAIAITLLAAFGLTLVFPGLVESMISPLVRLGAKLAGKPSNLRGTYRNWQELAKVVARQIRGASAHSRPAVTIKRAETFGRRYPKKAVTRRAGGSVSCISTLTGWVRRWIVIKQTFLLQTHGGQAPGTLGYVSAGTRDRRRTISRLCPKHGGINMDKHSCGFPVNLSLACSSTKSPPSSIPGPAARSSRDQQDSFNMISIEWDPKQPMSSGGVNSVG